MSLTPPNAEGTSNPAVLDGGQFGSQTVFATTPVAVASGGTVALSNQVTWNVLRPTGDTTIAAAVVNLPTVVQDGFLCVVVSTGAVTAVTGTVATATLPAITAFSAGQSYSFLYNAAAGLWFSAL
jgi:hypothetical protein